MFYLPTSHLDKARLPDVVEDLQPQDIILDRFEEGRVNKLPIDKHAEHMADVTVAMLYLACGGLDESHNIVIPYRYKWSFDLEYCSYKTI